MEQRLPFRRTFISSLIFSVVGLSSISYAQELEEVLVTSQKREQTLREVPISVNVMSGELLESNSITSIESMADYIPNLNMTQTGIGTNIAIRGIASGVNQGFEQSAALFIDGTHHGRAQLSRAPIFDVERVEVLRGPQSILFGKNSTAGAISITNARPEDEFKSRISALYEPEHNERDVRLMVTGPFSDTLSGRLAVLKSEAGGYITNTTLNRDESQSDVQVIRGMIRWQPTDDWDINLKLEEGTFDSIGRNVEVISPISLPIPQAVPYANVLGFLSQGTYLLETEQNFERQSNGDHSYNNTKNVTLDIEAQLGSHTLSSTTGYLGYDYDELCDCDFTGAPLFTIQSNEDYEQISEEIRLASDEDQTVSYIGGLFFQTSEIVFDDVINVPTNSLIGRVLASPPPAGVGPELAGAILGSSTSRHFTQDTDIAAIFAQATWNITDSSRLIIGARYTSEDKDASRDQVHHTPTGIDLPEGNPAQPYNVLYGLFNIEPYNTIYDSREESGFTPQITFQQDFDSAMLYASYTTGFKSGGFDVRSNSHPSPSINNAINASGGVTRPITGVFQFEDEEVTNYELGGKLSFGNTAELNIAIFRSEFDDLQTSQFDGAFSFNVTNASEAVVQGLELDGRWAVTDSLLFSGGLAYLDFEYSHFPNAQCYFGQVDNIAPAGDNLCDATGKRREFTPEWQGNLAADYNISLSNGWEISSSLGLIYSDSYLTTPALNPALEQDAYVKVNAHIALSGIDDKWEFALIGKNLTDEAIVTYANGLPIATTFTQGSSTGYYAFYERSRSVALQATVKF